MGTRIAAVLGFAVMLAGCGSSGNGGGPTTPTPSTGGNNITILAGTGGAYDDPSRSPGGAYGTGFSPGTLTVTAGTTVSWTNQDSQEHQPAADNGSFSGDVGPNGSYSFTFANKGTVTYHCKIHPTMTGTIIVQ